jgi:hypothetical protein
LPGQSNGLWDKREIPVFMSRQRTGPEVFAANEARRGSILKGAGPEEQRSGLSRELPAALPCHEKKINKNEAVPKGVAPPCIFQKWQPGANRPRRARV